MHRPVAALSIALAAACGGKVTDSAQGNPIQPNPGTGQTPASEDPKTVAGAPSASGPQRWLAFDSSRDGGTRGIYLVRSDGVGLARVSHSSAAEFEPAFSPDGRRLAYVSSESGHPQIHVLDFTTHGKVQLTHSPYGAHQPAWSPDGNLIAFTGLPEGLNSEGLSLDAGFNVHQSPRAADLFVIDVDGSGERSIIGVDTDGPAANYPSWFPANPTFGSDPNIIVYSANSYLHVVNLDGTGHRRIGGVPSSGTETPSISPDGSRIAFAVWAVDGQEIRAAEDTHIPADRPPYDLSSLIVGPSSTRMNRRPAWASTGLIVYERGPFPGPANLAIVAASGGESWSLTEGEFDNRNPAWAPPDFVPNFGLD